MVSFGKKAVLAAPAFALILILGTDVGQNYIRRLTVSCIRNIYASPTDILKIPEVAANTNNNVPAYIALCQNLLNEETGAYNVATAPSAGTTLATTVATVAGVATTTVAATTTSTTSTASTTGTLKEVIHVNEEAATCTDWGSPHNTIMDIVSALIVTRFTPLVRYRHNCDRTRNFDEATIGFDHSTIQQIISTPALGLQEGIGNSTLVYQQCRRCLMYFNPVIESARVTSKAHHHCFAWPDVATKNTVVSNIPNLPTGSKISPLSMVIQPLVQRYYHAAVQWRPVSDKPPQEEQSGVIIYLDQYTLGIDYSIYLKYIPAGATSITVLSGPLCAKAYLKTGQLCATYGQGLASSLVTKFPKLTTTGFNSGPGVLFQIAASTAGINSRLALSQLTICAPHTTSCYMPALSRLGGSSIVLEDPTWGKAIDFYTITGHQGKVTVVSLEASAIPPLVTATLPVDATLKTCSNKFTNVNVAVNGEGYPTTVVVPAMPTDELITKTTDVGILALINKKIGTFQSNPDTHAYILESVPSLAQVQLALTGKASLNVNVQIPNGWGAKGLTGELGLDTYLALPRAIYDLNYLNTMNGFRFDSIIRIKHDYQQEAWNLRRTARLGQVVNQVFEIKCPANAVSTSKGYQTTTTATRRLRVAVDHRNFKFGADLDRICSEAAAADAAARK